MNLSFIKSRQSVFLLFIVLLIASVFTFYYFNYVDNKKSALIQRNFRQLNTINTQIQQIINGLTLAATSITENTTVSPENLDKLNSLVIGLRDVEVEKLKAGKENLFENEKVNFESGYDTLFISVGKVISKPLNNYLVKLKKYGIREILERKKNQGLFDDFFLASNDGTNIIQLPQNIITITKIDSLITLDGKSSIFSELSKRDIVAKFTSGSENFLLFIHPMRLFISEESIQNQWIICGVISESEFRSESYAISYNTILLFLAIIILIIFTWPLLKLKFVSRYGRIRSYDITMATLSIAFIAAILSFIIVDFVVYDKLNHEVDQHLEKLSARIQNNFLKEICMVHSELDNMSDYIKLKDYKINNFFARDNYDKKQDSTYVKYVPAYKNFDLMHWSDKNGNQKFKFLMKEKKTPFINIGKREYFLNAMEGNVNSFWKNFCADSVAVFLQPLISLTTGEFSVTLSKKETIDSEYVGAVDFLPVSVYSAVLPMGFSFCIINQKGEVLFHSNKERNLAENFLNEGDNRQLLNAAIVSRAKEKFTINYWGKSSRIMINPIRGLPWYVVVMFEKDMLRRNNLETASVSVLLFLLYISPFIILLLFFLVIKGQSKNWVWPVINNASKYKELLLCYCILAFVLVLFYCFSTNQKIIFIATWLFPHSALILSGIIIVLKFQKTSHINDLPDYIKKEWQFSSIIVSLDIIIVLSILNSIEKISIAELSFLLLVWILLTFGSLFIILEISPGTEKVLRLKAKKFYGIVSRMKELLKDKESMRYTAKWYSIAVVAFLILGSVIPAIGFFSLTYETQIKSYIKQAQTDFIEKLGERKSQLNKYVNSGDLKQKSINEAMDIYTSCFYYTRKDASKNYYGKVSASNWFDINIVHELIPQVGEAGSKSKVLMANSADNFFTWFTNENDKGKELILNNSNLEDSVYVTELPGFGDAFFNRSTSFKVLIFIIIACSVFLFYLLVRYVMNSIFLIDADSLLYQKNYNLFNSKSGKNILLLSNKPSSAKKLKEEVNGTVIEFPGVIKEEFDADTKKAKWVLHPGAIAEEINSIVILNSFEYGFSNYEINELKLLLLEDLIYVKKKRIIIISSIHPLGGFSCTEPEASREKKQNKLYRWKDILSGFISTSRHVLPEEIEELKEEAAGASTLWEFIKSSFIYSPSQNSFIKHELMNKIVRMFHEEIYKIARELKIIAGQKKLNFSNVFDMAMDRARSYNQYLWDSCSMDEKLVLVRLAEDRFVPHANLTSVESLLRRGLLQREPNLKPYNSLFTNFILEANHPEEEYWNEQNSQSGWHKFRIPILIILAGIMTFLFSTQTEFYTNTLAVITSASILIPALLRLLGIFQVRQANSKTTD